MKTRNWDTPIGIALVVIIIVLCVIFGGSGGASGGSPRFPLEDMSENREMQAEYAEMTAMAFRHGNDPCYQDIMDGVPSEYSRCGNTATETTPEDIFEPTQSEYYAPTAITSTSCSVGCIYHKAGCDIKGNVSFNTGEKIYHLPGDLYYDVTEINPDYGERWFCTEDEARANGWRHAYP